jgi:hypothetical protein
MFKPEQLSGSQAPKHMLEQQETPHNKLPTAEVKIKNAY